MKGEHVMRHKPGVWHVIWSDMYIETTFMQSACEDVADMNKGYTDKEVMIHKEERPARIRSGAQGRQTCYISSSPA